KDYLGFANLEKKEKVSVEVRAKKITLLIPSPEPVLFKLTDVCGKVLQTREFNCSTEIDLSEFSTGVYICQFFTEYLQIQKKIIIQD
ncbi:MAG: T9SS C-terminal target domain-containing protein, partial [Sphingobacteriia bacterium]|nr:T9SS C-terminal target domain-containing protein [Sphingobacteriia bacterium]